ncbi:MAG: arginine--tRNA ligase [Prevotellaceae bacterium]|jgi:arginyl-tRNA synthetase|nr:arginine--tRNA ligase [Prevotellaceae bacterium]
MNIENIISLAISKAVERLYGAAAAGNQVLLQPTKKEFEGDLTVVTFAFAKVSGNVPEQVGQALGTALLQDCPVVGAFNVVKGFLNLSLKQSYWVSLLNEITSQEQYGIQQPAENAPLMMVEYSSPNTNKPLHLGHIRNNLLGYSIAEIQKANGWRVVKTNIVNDRGIHICKSMLAWQLFGQGETPATSGQKGDHLVGKYYVIFDREYKKQVAQLMAGGQSEEDAKKNAPLIQQAQQMLLAWEKGDTAIINLWKTMNQWVYDGFDITYRALGVDFDKIYYESDTYLTGKEEVERGLTTGIFYRRADGSVWADLTGDGLDEKLLLRSDGTSVYMTQDIGTAKLRYNDFPIDKMVYVVGNEQNYHFQILAVLLDKLGYAWGKNLVHFSYGMVELPEGKMKSREGTVVDADDLLEEMITTAREASQELGKLDECTPQEAESITRMVGLSALKYFILKVDPRKNMTFNPKESIDFNGNTGPFIQYTHARIKSILRRVTAQNLTITPVKTDIDISIKERYLIRLLTQYPAVVGEAGKNFSPALIANYAYELAKEYNQFYHDYPILREENSDLKNFRLALSENVSRVIRSAMGLLGIDVPDKM